MMTHPQRGEIWLGDFDPTRGRGPAGRRPALVVSVNEFNAGGADLVVVLPITSKFKDIPWHVEVAASEGGLKMRSFIKCEDVRSIAKERLTKRWGRVSPATLDAVEARLRILLEL